MSEGPVDWPLDDLRPHPANDYFDEPEDCEEFDAIVSSIRTDGLFHPITIAPDGLILGGHLRAAAFRKLGRKSIPAVVREIATYRDGLVFLIKDNAARRQLTKGQVALLYAELRKTPKEEGGTAKKRGRKEGVPNGSSKAANNGAQLSTIKARDEAAEILNVSRNEAERLETVFTTPGVPDELKRAVDKGEVAPSRAASAVRSEVKRQGGAIVNPTPLKAVAEPKARLLQPAESIDPAERRRREASHFMRKIEEARAFYQQSHAMLRGYPLSGLTDGWEREQYTAIIRDIALLWWREVENACGETKLGKQMQLKLVVPEVES